MLTHVDLRMERAHFAYAYWVEKGERAKVGGGFRGRTAHFIRALIPFTFHVFSSFFWLNFSSHLKCAVSVSIERHTYANYLGFSFSSAVSWVCTSIL